MGDRQTAETGADEGTMALELALVAPVLLVLVALMFTYGRLSQVQGLVEATARDGARVATQSRSFEEADARVTTIQAALVGSAPSSCADTAVVDVVPKEFEPDDLVTVAVRCTVAFSDLGVPGAPGSIEIRRSFSSRLDPYRGLDGFVPPTGAPDPAP